MTAAERREQLIEISRALFAARGFDGTSIEEIAARAEVSKPVVYEHFGGKEGLYAVVVDREVRSLLGMMQDSLTAGQPRMLLEQVFWGGAWLAKYEPDDYPRVRDRMVDILLNGIAPEGSSWEPAPISMNALAEGPELARETFLLAATRLINRRGYRGASVDKISAELNVTKGSFYHHNEAKDDLVVACFDRTFDVMTHVQRLAMTLPGDEWVRLSSAAAALAEYQLSEHGPLLRTSALAALPEKIRQEMVKHSDRVSDRFAAMISDGIAEASLRAVDPFLAAQMLNATLNAAAELGHWVPGVSQKAAPAVYVRPLLMGVFER